MSKFAEVLDDETLFYMDSPMEIVKYYIPDNYTPTQEQMKSLVTSAVESVIQWYKLQREWNEQDGRTVVWNEEQSAYLLARLKEANAVQSNKEV